MKGKNKFVVAVMAVTTFAFVGVGFVGWGSYQFGSSSGTIAKVGSVDVTYSQFRLAYNNVYSFYAQMMGGQVPEESNAQINDMAYNTLLDRAYFINLAQDIGLSVDDKEIFQNLSQTPQFQEDDRFNQEIYLNRLGEMGIKPLDYEENLRHSLLIQKLYGLLELPNNAFETLAGIASNLIANKFQLRFIIKDMLEININDEELKAFWQDNKDRYMDSTKYDINYLAVKASQFDASDEEVSTYFSKNNDEFVKSDGALKSLEEAKDEVLLAVKLKKARKQALKDRLNFKKGNAQGKSLGLIDDQSDQLPKLVLENLAKLNKGTFSKPILADNTYFVLQIKDIIEPKPLEFIDARSLAKVDFKDQKTQETAIKKAEELMKDDFEGIEIDFITRNSVTNLVQNPLLGISEQEASNFLEQLFVSKQTKGFIDLGNKLAVYKIIDQRLNAEAQAADEASQNQAKALKANLLRTAILGQLKTQYNAANFSLEENNRGSYGGGNYQ